MKKLLLVLLVPVMVLGLMVGCGYETGSEMNAYLQGVWTAVTTDGAGWEDALFPFNGGDDATVDHDLFITPNEMVVRYTALGKTESIPFNLQFKSAHSRYRTVSFGAGSIGAFASLANTDANNAIEITSASDTVGARKRAFVNGLQTWTINDTEFGRQTKEKLRDLSDSDKIDFFNFAATTIIENATNVNDNIENTLVGGTLLVSDYRSGAELATLTILVLTEEFDNFRTNQFMLVANINWSEDIPFYMLTVPLQLGGYVQ